jgi:light-regulated signal transduction histidine kinase (bacteriophytochrome)
LTGGKTIASGAMGYILAPVAVFLALLIRIALGPWVGSSIPFATFFIATLWLAWYRGFGAAAFGVVLSVVAGGHFILHDGAGHFLPVTSAGRAAITGFGIVSLSAALLIDLQHRTLRRAQSAELEQRRANEQLARVNRDLETFAFSASHDLQEPMRTISLSADYLENSLRGRLQGDETRFLGYMRSSALRMTALLDGLLLYAKLGEVELNPPPSVEVRGVLEEVRETLRIPISAAGANISWGSLPRVAVQETHLVQIFQNLLGNALKYGGKRIEISAARRDGFWLFSVADDGVGISMEYADQIFGLFKRLGGDSEGSGVGLAICRRMVERYGGRIWLSDSKPGQGSTFCFTAPAADGQRVKTVE